MNLKSKNILITGAAGGNLPLHELTQEKLHTPLEILKSGNSKTATIALDLMGENAGPQLVAQAKDILQGLDMEINLAGVQTFKALASQNKIASGYAKSCY